MDNPYSYFERFMAFTGSATSDEVHVETPNQRNGHATVSNSGIKRDQGDRNWKAADVRRVQSKSPPAVHNNNAEPFDSFEEVYIEDAPYHYQQAEPQLHHRHHPQQHEGHHRSTETRATTRHALHELGQSLTHSFSELAGRARSFGSNHRKGRGDDEAPELTKSDSDGDNTGTSTTDSSAELDDPENPRPVTIVETTTTTTTTNRGRSRSRRGHSEANSARSASRHDQEEHLSWFAHGFKWTVIGILFSWLGFTLAILARQSTSFVRLETPLQVDPVFEPVVQVGMMNLKLCYNETYLGEEGDMGCTIHRLDSDEVNDAMFQVSRILLSMAILVGGFMSIFLTTASFWSSINLRPIGVGCLICYFLQSFSFLFFDTNLCAQYTCRISTGCYFSIVASACWIVACVASSRMEAFKLDQKQKKRKLERRKAKIAAAMGSMEIQEIHTSKSKIPEKRSRASPEKQSRPGAKTGREEDRPARSSFVVIDGIQDPKAHEAWLERQTERVKHHTPRGGGGANGADIHIEVARPGQDRSLERRVVTDFQATSSSWATESLPPPHEKRRSSPSKKTTRQPSAAKADPSPAKSSSRGRVRSELDRDLNRSSSRRRSDSRSRGPAVVITVVDTGAKKTKTERTSSSSDMKRSRTNTERARSSSEMNRSRSKNHSTRK